MPLPTPASGQPPPRELVFLNWFEYMDPDLIRRFEQQHQVKVHEIYYESDDVRDEMLLETDGKGYDVVLVNGSMIATYLQRGWLEPLTPAQIPNLQYADPYWLKAFDGVEGHAVPYFWGTLGIAYRADLLDSPPESWMDLFKPAPQVHDKIAMIETQRDAMGMALKALGYSANSTDSQEIRTATELLIAQRPYVKTYTYLVLDENSALVKGDVVMAMMFNGDALMLQQQHEGIRYLVPKEGGNIWADYLVVMSGAKHKALAYAFIDFLNQPEQAAQLARYVYYATPNQAAEKLLPVEFLADPIIYPTSAILEKSEAYKPLPPRVIKLRNSNFSRLTQ
ncbi:MAG: spermidine/putrescine ABC transporter substrate-binding protein [Chromatiales bacterium]